MNINQVNAIIRESTPEYTNMAFIRHIKRQQVYNISQSFANHDLAQKREQIQLGILNEEPWPFSDPNFGLITAADGTLTRFPFYNQSGFPIGTPEAYCAAMIHNRTGRWPQPIDFRTHPDIEHYAIARRLWVDSRHTFDARNWASFLALNKYTQHTKSPQTNHYYIGINPNEGETGLVVWFHRRDSGSQVTVSTRINEFRVYQASIFDFAWVKIL